MTDQVIILTVVAVPLIGIALRHWLKPKLKRTNRWISCFVRSFFYSLFFGLGALGAGGGEPGFMLPAPVLAAAILDSDNLMKNSIVPLLFWWGIFFSFLLLKEFYKIYKERRDLA